MRSLRWLGNSRHSSIPAWRGAASAGLVLLGLSAGCGGGQPPAAAPCAPGEPPATVAAPTPAARTPAEADAFIAAFNAELTQLLDESDRTSWVKATYITDDTEALEAKAHARLMEFLARKIKEARRFEGLPLRPETQRALYLLRYSTDLPAPHDAARRKELAELASKLEGLYGRGKACSPKFKGHGKDKQSECLELGELSDILAKSSDWELELEAWRGWHGISREMRPLYERFVELGNEGARELGFADVGEIWKGRYDMSAAAFSADMDRLWGEVRPLYEALHCYTRKKLRARYGAEKIPVGAPIPAHVLGNMWAQEWTNLYPLLEPYQGRGTADLTPALRAKKYDAMKMVRTAEGFFTSLGLAPLPQSFFERSLFLKPRDRSVVCHASAWDVGLSGDLRIKMCIEVNQEDFVTLHHELGHNYYFLYYHDQPALFQSGANDGFHEGVGDTLALSVTPKYLKAIGLVDKPEESPEAALNLLMHRALEGIAFLPFGKLIDEWRWDVFSGKTKPSEYNAAWWALREKIQGVAPPLARSEADFDPGAKYHIPGNTPYVRYFIARILQYQFHRALCKVAGHTGPLHTCSIYGSKAAGDKLRAMLELGASRPWPEALAVLGETRLDASALKEYYEPLMSWLAQQNAGERCGW